MKNLKALALMALGILAGLGAAIFAASWVGERANIAAAKVVVAAVDIEPGSKINPQMLTSAAWPSGSIPQGAFTDIKQLQDRVVRTNMGRGEAFVERKLMPPGAQGGLSAVISEGKRAMTVRVNDVVGVAGFALPGNYVDVMLNAKQDQSRGEQAIPVSMTVLENVLVLAIAQEANRDETKPKVVNAVTLELSLADAEKLDLARSVGTLSLVLRNQLDKTKLATTGISKQDLFKFKETPTVVEAPAAKPVQTVALRKSASTPKTQVAAPMQASAPICVEVIRNGTRAMNCF